MSTTTALLSSQIKQQKSQETRQEVEQLLNSAKQCVVVRPTGFGKTFLMVDLAKNYDKVYYFYPQECLLKDIRNKYSVIPTMEATGQWESISYMKLVSMGKDIRLQSDFHHTEMMQNTQKILFILDEAHMIGAPQTSKVIHDLMSRFPNAHWLGATATPDRTDDTNIIKEFFNGFQTSEYTLVNAINDGVYPKPHYVTAYYEIDPTSSTLSKKIESMIFTGTELKKKITRNLNRKKLEYADIHDMTKTLGKYLDHKASYLKFICFFPTQKALKEQYTKVIQSFQNIYPNHTINTVILMSDNIHKNNIDLVQNMAFQNNTIDLVFCIDMLNMGYHVDDLDGIVMLRRTNSDIIYLQQLGRCLSISAQKQPIIFDFVENCDICGGFTTVFDQNKKKGNRALNGFGKETVIMHDETKDIVKTARMTNIMCNASLDVSLIIDAYLHKSAPIGWVLKQLKTKQVQDLQNILELCDEKLRPEDEKLLTQTP